MNARGPVGLRGIFKTSKPIIGALHFAPLLGCPQFKGFDYVLRLAIEDLRSFERGGIDGIIIENNYDSPPKTFVDPESVSAMTYLGLQLKKIARVPLGVSVLWNDYRAALSIAKVIGARFVRVPVFVDSVKTDFDTIYAEPEKVVAYRKKIGAGNIQIFSDVHVKHASLLNMQTSLATSARRAESKGADAIIVTGRWTADPPKPEMLEEAKKSVHIPLIIGSGLDYTNAHSLFNYADGAIVSTSLKEGGPVKGERQVKPYTARIEAEKVARLMREVKKSR